MFNVSGSDLVGITYDFATDHLWVSDITVVRKFDPATPEITEGDAVIAYLQMLGTLVDFKQYDDKANLR